jgi:hypothetical protein
MRNLKLSGGDASDSCLSEHRVQFVRAKTRIDNETRQGFEELKKRSSSDSPHVIAIQLGRTLGLFRFHFDIPQKWLRGSTLALRLFN